MNPARVRLFSQFPAISVEGWIGPNGAVVTQGYGGWTVVDRPHRQGLTLYTGRTPFKMSVQIVLDGFIAGRSVEHECSALERMALSPEEPAPPPILQIAGATVPHRDIKEWVIDTDGITWEDVERDRTGARIRQVVTVLLLRYVKDTRLKSVKASAQARKKVGGGDATSRAANQAKSKIYIVRAGDTLVTIAASQLGSPARWTEIADLNDIRDPRSVKPGQKIRIP